MIKIASLFIALITLAVVLFWVAIYSPADTIEPAGTQVIFASNTTIKIPTCPPGKSLNALFTINNVTPSNAPSSILVGLNGDSTVVFNLFFSQGSPLARYKGSAPKGVNFGQATIFSAWVGIFELEEYFCGSNIPPTTTTTSTTSTTSTTTTTTTSTTTTIPSVTTTTSGSTTTSTPSNINIPTHPFIPPPSQQPQPIQPQPIFVTG